MSAWGSLLLVWLLAVPLMALGWHWQRRRANSGIVDVLWAAGVGGAALLLAALGDGALAPRAAMGTLGGLWGLRLAWHLWRRVRHEPEDGRYRALRAHWQGDQRKLLAFFQAQALLVALFALPFVAVAANPASSPAWLTAGLAVWLVGVLGEAIADAQLARFRARPQNCGRTCRDGLWRYSRHPNYFFEWLHWFAYVAFAVGSPLAWLAWSGPLLMLLFLRFVSGIPFTEAQALRTRGEDYRAYQRSTPMLFPWFPKRSCEPRMMGTAAVNPVELPADRAAPGLLGLAERGLLPDALLRLGMRRLCAARLREERAGGVAAQAAREAARLELLLHSPLAIETAAANAQHYELPPAFFEHCLGPRLKYSCCYYPRGDETLAEAEEAMLALYGERAQLADGQHILELGCGWGSLTLWMAERYPRALITAVSNSHAQRLHIEAQCRERGLSNVQVLTRDVNTLMLEAARFDRCVSIEMFEHLRNYPLLLRRIAGWLAPGGKLFVHIFAHRTLLYPFETAGADNWIGRHFFTGGLMPAADTLLHFQQDLAIERRWLVDGTHYRKTANHWLVRQDSQRGAVMAALREAYGERAALWFQRWRMFWMACAELFGHAGGQEWLVAHYRFARPDAFGGRP